MRKTLISLGLAVVLCLSGCSTSQAQISRYNAQVYVQGVLDETYTGTPQEAYLTLTGRTAEQAKGLFEKNLSAEYTQRLAVRFELEDQYIPHELREDFRSLLAEVYQKAGYTVKSATPMEDGRYCVELSVTPVTFFAAAYSDGYAKLRQDFEEDHPLPGEADEDDEDEEGETPEPQDLEPAQLRKAQADYEAAWAQTVYDYLYARLDAITTGPSVTLLVLVTPDSQGRYTLSATDLQNIDDLILQY